MKELYLIDVPPPTISGALHMGHVFSYCHMDFIARFQELQGKQLVYPFCFDCNGLPTEKLASKAGIRGTEDIIKFAIEKSAAYEEHFTMQKMNWSKERYHSYSDMAVEIANLSFQDLKNKGLAYKAVRPYYYCPVTKVSVSQSEIDENGCYERSGAKVEVREGEGWFINIMDHLPRIRSAIDEIKWHPDYFRERLHSWLDQVQYDWSISRERNFGIAIPGEAPGIVFDTWFTSSLTPQMAWASHTGKPSLQCPIFDARFQAHDIIRTWALFTIIKSVYHNDQIPWKNIIISGHALDSKENKLSKSAGNATPPIEYFKQYDAYGVRFWAAQNQTGTDTKIDSLVMSKGKKLANKLRNAKKFLTLHANEGGKREDWLTEWFEAQKNISQHLNNFDYANAQLTLTQFFWSRFCDVFIEESKKSGGFESLNKILGDITDWYEIYLPGIKGELKTL
jgi:valyl-tRNA synthetase